MSHPPGAQDPPKNHGVICVAWSPEEARYNADPSLFIHLPAPHADIHTRGVFYKEKFVMARAAFAAEPDLAALRFRDPVAKVVSFCGPEDDDAYEDETAFSHEDWKLLNEGEWPSEYSAVEKDSLAFNIYQVHGGELRGEWGFLTNNRQGMYETDSVEEAQLLDFIEKLDTTHLPCTIAGLEDESSSPSTQTPESEDHHPES